MGQEVSDAHQLASKASVWRSKSEAVQMRVEDLESALTRQAERRSDLVAAYWPVMLRLRVAEGVVRALDEQIRALGLEPAAAMPRPPPGAEAAEEAAARMAASGGSAVVALGVEGGGHWVGEAGADHLGLEESGAADLRLAAVVGVGGAFTSSQPPQQQPAQRQQRAQQQQEDQQRQTQQQQLQQQQGGAVAASQGAGGDAAGCQALEAQLIAAREEHDRLSRSWLLLQDEYWVQKERVMALKVEAGQLRSGWRAAEEKLQKVGVGAGLGREGEGACL